MQLKSIWGGGTPHSPAQGTSALRAYLALALALARHLGHTRETKVVKDVEREDLQRPHVCSLCFGQIPQR